MNIHILTASIMALALSGCMGGGAARAPGFAAALPVMQAAPARADPIYTASAADGSIYQASQGYASLHEGLRARRVGDLVTIVLTESVGSSKSTGGKTNRSGSASITPPATGLLSFLKPDALKAAGQGSFSGSGTASQSSSLSGAVAVTIAEVRPNGTALVVGEKQMKLSQGDEWVQFAGILRLSDIDFDNRIASSQIADAQIIYSGKGAVQQASRPGWLSRFFNAVSPF